MLAGNPSRGDSGDNATYVCTGLLVSMPVAVPSLANTQLPLSATAASLSQAKPQSHNLLSWVGLCLPQTHMLNVTLCGDGVVAEVGSYNEAIRE